MFGFGSMLKDYLEYYKITQRDFADMLGISQKHVSEIISGTTKISEDLMIAISLITDIDINLIVYVEKKKEIHEYFKSKYKSEKEIKEFLNSYYINEMVKLNWITLRHKEDLDTTALDLLNFLKIKNFDVEESYINKRILYKKYDDANMKKVFLWIRHCDSLITNINVPNYSSSKLNSLFEELKNESLKKFNKDSIIKILNKYGIILVLEDALKGTKIRGCTMVKIKTPVIYMTSYFKTKDSFYFTLYHELSHIKSDYNKLINKIMVLDDEKDMDDFSLNMMIDNKIWNSIKFNIDGGNINEICEEYKLDKSFIVGRLAKEDLISYKSKLYNDNIEKIIF